MAASRRGVGGLVWYSAHSSPSSSTQTALWSSVGRSPSGAMPVSIAARSHSFASAVAFSRSDSDRSFHAGRVVAFSRVRFVDGFGELPDTGVGLHQVGPPWGQGSVDAGWVFPREVRGPATQGGGVAGPVG
jgi:hypothetical protein